MAEEVGMVIAPMIIEPLIKRVIRHVLYAFNLNKIVEELKQETAELNLTRDLVKHDVDRARSNAEEIEEFVATWQIDAEEISAEVERLEEDIDKKKNCFNGLYPNLLGQYRFGKQAMKKKYVMTKLREKGKFSRVSYFPNSNLPKIEFYETKDYMPSTSTRSAFSLIMKELEDDAKKVIALHGMGGVGKTMLAVEVGKKAKELKLVDEVIMVVVSQNPSIEGIQGQIADMIGLRFEESSSVGKANRLHLRFKKIEKKVLIILDDVWSRLDLTAIGIPSNDDGKNCKVLLTTRQRQVCSVMGSQCDIALDLLTDEEAWTLFSRCGGLTSNVSFPFIDVAKSVAKECKGLPLAIITVAKALKGKTRNEWEVSLIRLRGSRYVGISDADQDVYKCIRFSYDYLQDKEVKLCFLLCSLFPEDHSIEVEELVRYMHGLGLCRDVVDSIDRVRAELHVVITGLKASSLLLSGNDNYGRESGEFVKLHDIVRDVALWISSGDKNNLSMVRAGMGLEEWPRSIHYQLLTRVSLMKNEIAEHRGGLLCSRLNLLLLDENGCYEFLNEFFYGMKGLQVLSISHRHISWRSPTFSLPQSIQHLANLSTLRIEWLQLNDISILGKLKGLEILSLRGSHLEELPSTIGELNGLRLLDLSNCNSNMIIPDKLLRKLYKLEELYIQILQGDEGSCNAILSDLMSLSKLSLLSLEIGNIACICQDICFPKHLVRYYINCGGMRYSREYSYPTLRELILEQVVVSKLNAFKEIIPGVNSLSLNNIKDDCIPNIIPAIDQSGLGELTSLSLNCCHNMECLLDTTDPDWIPTTAFSRLNSLHIWDMNCIRGFIRGLPPNGLFKELQKLCVCYCDKLCIIVPAKLSGRLPKLKEVIVEDCKEVKELFELDLVCTVVKENELLLSNLESLMLCDLPKLTRIWKGSTIEALSLAKLKKLEVVRCPKLTSLLSLSHSRSLVQLQALRVSKCNELKQIFADQGDEGRLEIQSVGHEPMVLFPQLKVLELEELPNFTSFWHENYIPPPLPLMPSLEELSVVGCPNIGTQFIADLQVYEKNLHELEVEGLKWSKSCNLVLGQLMQGSRTSLRELSITGVEGLQPLIPGVIKVEEELTIRGCKGIEELLQVGEGRVGNASAGGQIASSLKLQISWKYLRLENVLDLTCIWKGPSQILIFNTLQELHVFQCHGLKNHLLTTSIARSLLHLTLLEVKDCKELVQIFADDETGDRDKKNVVTLPRLIELYLVQLPNLISFCPASYYFLFPFFYSQNLSVEGCPKNSTGFFRCEGHTKWSRTGVHAKGEALCSSENRGKCNDIHDTKCLPLYSEETDDEMSVGSSRHGN